MENRILNNTHSPQDVINLERLLQNTPSSEAVENMERSLHNRQNPEAVAKGEVESRLTSPELLLSSAADKIVLRFVQQIAPHYVTERIRLEKSDDGRIKSASKLVKNKLYSEASEVLIRLLSDQTAAGLWAIAAHNLGVVEEVEGKYAEAEAHYVQAVSLVSSGLHMNALSRVRRRIVQQEQLRQQTGVDNP